MNVTCTVDTFTRCEIKGSREAILKLLFNLCFRYLSMSQRDVLRSRTDLLLSSPNSAHDRKSETSHFHVDTCDEGVF